MNGWTIFWISAILFVIAVKYIECVRKGKLNPWISWIFALILIEVNVRWLVYCIKWLIANYPFR